VSDAWPRLPPTPSTAALGESSLLGSPAGSIPGLAGVAVLWPHCAGSDGVGFLRCFPKTAKSCLDPGWVGWTCLSWPQCLLPLTQLLRKGLIPTAPQRHRREVSPASSGGCAMAPCVPAASLPRTHRCCSSSSELPKPWHHKCFPPAAKSLLASRFRAGDPKAPRRGCGLSGTLCGSGPRAREGQLCDCSQRDPSQLLVLAIANPCAGCKPKHGQGSLPGTSQPPRWGG